MIQIGMDYYPEQWDPSLWEEDAARMAALGVKVVRIAEFAWSRMEPREGEFHFEWLDEAIRVLAGHGMRVILGTPTNCPPLWMYQHYPETLQQDRTGQRVFPGIRGHRCMMSPKFRFYARRVVGEMARRYAGRPEIFAWQIDNELESNHCTCPTCRAGFRDFLRQKYHTLDRLNDAWGNVVWSGEYSGWEQIQPPLGPDYETDWMNPAWLQDYERYAAAGTADYVRAQCGWIRQEDPEARITTNSCFPAHLPDFYQEFAPLDVAAYDNYPVGALPRDPEALYSNGFALDFVRSFKQKNFWVLEQLAGPTGCWAPMNPAMEPGMLEGYALQAVAHGADLLSFFRWRTAATGAEMFCHGLLDHDNQPNRRYWELEQLIRRLERYPRLDETALHSEVALLYAPDQEFAFQNKRQSPGFAYWTQLRLLHEGCMNLGVNVDVLPETASLEGYRVALVPTWLMAREELVHRLEDFARRGGTVLLTNRSGVKDEHNNCLLGQPLPGPFRALAGCRVTEYDPIGAERTQQLRSASGQTYAIHTWCDLLEPEGAEVWAAYAGRYYAGTAAITRHRFGGGQCYYVGTVGEKALYRDLLACLFREAGVDMVPGLPPGVELTCRSGPGGRYRFLFNNTMDRQTVHLEGTELELAPLEVRVQTEKGEWQ